MKTILEIEMYTRIMLGNLNLGKGGGEEKGDELSDYITTEVSIHMFSDCGDCGCLATYDIIVWLPRSTGSGIIK